MKKYVCKIYNGTSGLDRKYEVTNSSAMKCAEKHGRYEPTEVVTVCTKTGRVISRVICGADMKYYRAQI